MAASNHNNSEITKIESNIRRKNKEIKRGYRCILSKVLDKLRKELPPQPEGKKLTEIETIISTKHYIVALKETHQNMEREKLKTSSYEQSISEPASLKMGGIPVTTNSMNENIITLYYGSSSSDNEELANLPQIHTEDIVNLFPETSSINTDDDFNADYTSLENLFEAPMIQGDESDADFLHQL